MTASYQHSLRRAGAHFTMGCQQQRGVALRPVVASQEDMAMLAVFQSLADSRRPVPVSIWNKTGAGSQN